MHTVLEAERLLEACAAGYVPKSHPDVRRAQEIVRPGRTLAILSWKTSRFDAVMRRVGGCYGTSKRR